MSFRTAAFLISLLGLHAGLSAAAGGAEGDAGRMTIGFRSVGQEEKDLLTKAGSLIQSRNTAATHLGQGVYIGNSPIKRDDESLFIVTADEAAFKATSKVWVPKDYWTLPVKENDILGEREAAISRDQLEHYIEDQGLHSTRTIRLSKIEGAVSDDILQLLIPNEMISHDQDGVPIETDGKLDTKVEELTGSMAWNVDYDEWEGIQGSKEYTEDTLRARIASLLEKATKAVTEAEKLLESDSPAAAEAISEAVATAKRCAEGVGHFHRHRPDWVDFDEFNTVYKQYSNARKAEAKLRKLKLTKAVEAQKSRLTQAAEKVNDDATRASGIAEAEQAADESNKLLKTAAEEVGGAKIAHEKLESVRKQLNGGDQKEFIELLAKNPRAVWATLQESFTSMNGKEAASLDAAIIDEADITQAEYSIFQEGVDEAKAMAAEIGESVRALQLVVGNPKILCRRGDVNCVHVSSEENGPTAEKPVKAEPADEGELIAIAQQRSKESFDNLLTDFNYKSVVKHDQLYKELNDRLPEFNTVSRTERIAGLSAKLGEGALAVAGLALYGKAVADVFSSDASVLDKAAVVTSILPGVGCAVQLADSVEHGNVDVGHTALCFTEDALLVSGFWEIALVMQLTESLVNWIEAGNEQDKLFNTEVLRSKGLAGWEANFDRMLQYIGSDEFAANTTTRFSSYQILVLYQASQLTGDLHASHKAISGKSSNETDEIVPHIEPELRRQVCAAMAQSKYQLRQNLEAVALHHAAKFSEEYKDKFLKDYREAATKAIPFLGIPISFGSGNLDEVLEDVRRYPLPLHEERIKKAIKEVVERLDTPAPCKCLQGSKQRPCEFADCNTPKPPRGKLDAAGRTYVTNVQSIEHGKRIGLWDDCLALFTTCPYPGSTGEIGRQIWCTPRS
ncbi:hypothetical protein J3458_006951 [Metarhizium acridum]|uniref:uncharacterized protein n=1 Tax=Metarhizium acridum TaxID=92637 RepID=UPI001C6A94F2|nr:hypothetical protein J3458_006951 [Metarhizium acridum]